MKASEVTLDADVLAKIDEALSGSIIRDASLTKSEKRLV